MCFLKDIFFRIGSERTYAWACYSSCSCLTCKSGHLPFHWQRVSECHCWECLLSLGIIESQFSAMNVPSISSILLSWSTDGRNKQPACEPWSNTTHHS